MILSIEDIYVFILVFGRLGGFLSLFPIIGGKWVPVWVRLGVGLMLGLMIMPLVRGGVVVPGEYVGWGLGIVKEGLIGLLMGFVVKGVFFISEFVGSLIANEISLTRSEQFDPLMQVQSGTMSSLLYFLLGLVLFGTDLHLKILEGFVVSYERVGMMGEFELNEGYLIGLPGEIVRVGVQIAAPLVAFAFVTNVLLAVIGKVVPRMNVFVLSFGVQILGGLVLFLAGVGLIAKYFYEYGNRIPVRMLEVLMR